ncbi:MAG: hypothetical protein LBE12_11490 [Planctomycetaceae bacterium]|jgi:multisubunit Na+/H+ antiporter MnhB subunit|nr:hypothetical protein [Planctomycetaceae bacterium]
MLSQFRNTLLTLIFGVLFFFQPIFCFGAEASEEAPDWVLSYFLVLLFLSFAILVLLRPTKRSDSAFTVEELAAQQEEAMKKMLGH